MVKFEGWSGILVEGLLRRISEMTGATVAEVKRYFGDAVTDPGSVMAIVEAFEYQRNRERELGEAMK